MGVSFSRSARRELERSASNIFANIYRRIGLGVFHFSADLNNTD